MSNPTNVSLKGSLTRRLRSAAAPRPATVVFRQARPDSRFTLLRLMALIVVTAALSALSAPALFPGLP